MKKILLGLLLATLASTGWGQAKFSYFGPVNGILKGSTTTWETTQAADTDVLNLWGGTCSNTTYLRGDGICSTPPGTGGGTVNSVSQTVPAGFAVGGSPVTNTGTLAITYATGQTNHLVLGTGTAGQLGLIALTTADIPTIPLASGVSGLLPVANGGTGIGTLTGLLKGNGTSAFSVAASADVIGLWTGTCSSTTFLRGDGACAAPAASGTVTSVGLSWTGSGLTIGGTPVTTSGAFAISGALAPTAGGTGAFTLTGVLKGNGTSAFTSAAAADVYGLWSGTCSSATFLRGDGSCAAPGGATGANPTATVGPTANNGSSTNFMRADASPAFCLSCAFTQTGNWIFAPGSGVGVAVVDITNGANGTPLQVLSNNQTVITTYGWDHINTNSGTYSLNFNNNPALEIISGNVVIPSPPGGGFALSVTSGVSSVAGVIRGAASTGSALEFIDGNTGNKAYAIGSNVSIAGDFEIYDFSASTSRFQIGTNGNVTIPAPSSGNTLTSIGPANALAGFFIGSSTSGQSFGLAVAAGTTSADIAFSVTNQANNTYYQRTFGDGGFVIGNPTGGDKGLGTINAQAYYLNGNSLSTQIANQTNETWTLTGGCSGGVSPSSITVSFTVVGDTVFATFPNISCTSSGGTTFTMSGTFPTNATPGSPHLVLSGASQGVVGSTIASLGAISSMQSGGLVWNTGTVATGVFNACIPLTPAGGVVSGLRCEIQYHTN